MSRRMFPMLAVLVLAFVAVVFPLSCRDRREATTVGSSSQAAANRTPAFPTGIAIDRNGNLYVVAHKKNRVLKISPARRVTVVAGNGSMGFSGDGGPADRASLDLPVSVALDPYGNLFIADTGNNRIRRVDAKTNLIATVAVDWLYEPISVAVDKDENIYIGGTSSGPIRRVDAITHIATMVIGADLPGYTLATTPATGPFWVAVDENGTLLFSDPNRNTVSQFNAQENTPHRIAGSAVCGFAGDGGPANGALLCYPEALSVAKGRLLFIADTANNRIRRVDLSTGIITTMAGNGVPGYAGDGGPAIKASLNGPMGIAADEKGDIYIADTGNNCIRHVDTRTGVITTFATARELDVPGSSNSQP